MTLIYKILSETEFEQAATLGVFAGAAVDLADGYIHFSDASQVQETARRHFAGKTGLVLVAVQSESLGSALKWEPSRGGDLFPHLYGSLDFSLMGEPRAIRLDDDGMPEVESLLP